MIIKSILPYFFCLFFFLPNAFGNVANPSGDSFYEKGKKAYQTKEYADAQKYFEQASTAYLAEKNWEDYLRCVRHQGKSLKKLKKPLQAAHKLQIGLDKSQAFFSHHADYIKTMRYLSDYLVLGGKSKESEEVVAKAIEIAKKGGLETSMELGFLYGGLGSQHSQTGDYEKAITYFQQDVNLLEKYFAVDPNHKDKYQLGTACYNLATTFQEVGNQQQAIDLFEKAAPLWIPKFGEKFEFLGYLYNSLGTLYFELNNKEKALFYFEKAATIHLHNNGITEDEAAKLQTSGLRKNQEGDHDAALEFYRLALQSRIKNLGKTHPASVGCYNYINRILVEKEAYEEVVKNSQTALALFSGETLSGTNYPNPTNLKGLSSKPYTLEALSLKTHALLQIYLNNKSKVTELKAGFETIKVATNLIDDLRIGSESAVFWTQNVWGFFEDALTVTYELYQITKEEQYLETAFMLSEKSKSFVLQKSLLDLAAKKMAHIPADVLQKEQHFRKQIGQYEQFLISEEKKCAAANAVKVTLWKENLFNLNQEYEQFIKKLERNYPDYYALKYNVKTTTIKELHKNLRNQPKTALVTFFVGDSKIYSFSICKNNIRFNRTAITPVFNQTILDYRKSLTDLKYIQNDPQGSFEVFAKNGNAIYKRLLANAFWKSEEIDKVLIVPDGMLGYIPFETLLTEKVNAQSRNYTNLPYLLKSYEISYYHSLTLLAAEQTHRKKQFSKEYTYLGFAPDYHASTNTSDNAIASTRSQLTTLKHNTTEVENAIALFKGKSFLKNEATEFNFKTNAHQARILHLAMHALLNDENPMQSKLVFANSSDTLEDGYLNIYELYSSFLGADLAVLSACNTGSGQMIRGEGIMSLARGFAYADCPSVVMSLWQVDDDATNQINTTFFKELANESPKNQALRRAKLEYLEKADPSQAHPYYWGGLTLIGDVSPIKKPSLLWIWSLAGVVLTLGGVWYFRRKWKA